LEKLIHEYVLSKHKMCQTFYVITKISSFLASLLKIFFTNVGLPNPALFKYYLCFLDYSYYLLLKDLDFSVDKKIKA